jgi:hypothetical protein
MKKIRPHVMTVVILMLLGSAPVWAQRVTQDMKIGCEQLLNRQISQEQGGERVQATLRTWRDQPVSNALVKLTGEADVTVNGIRQTVVYECTFNVRTNYAESASYRLHQGGSGWGRPGGSGSTGGDWNSWGMDSQQNEEWLRARCSDALQRRISSEERIRFPQVTITETRTDSPSRGVVRLRGQANVGVRGSQDRQITFDCRANRNSDLAEVFNWRWGTAPGSPNTGWGGLGAGSGTGGGILSGGGGSGGAWGLGGRPNAIPFDRLPGFELRGGGRQNQIDLQMEVDGLVDIYIRDRRVRYDVINGRPPQDNGSQAGQPLPRTTIFCEVEKRRGRNEIRVIEQPSRNNNFTLHLQIDDRQGGSDRYQARIRW